MLAFRPPQDVGTLEFSPLSRLDTRPACTPVNAWPFTVDPDARRDGAIEEEYVAPNYIFSRLRAAGAEVIQYNHPRAGVAGTREFEVLVSREQLGLLLVRRDLIFAAEMEHAAL